MIKQIKAKNFLSWETLSFTVKSGVTLIDGFNRDDNTSEGSGKSAVLNALCWGIYGKIPKDANIDDVIRTGEKGCVVKIYCDDFIIVRSRNKNDLFIETIENKKVKGKDVRETQKMIEDLINMTFDTFCQTVYFAQNYPKKFITATQEDKGKILSEIQDLQIFDKARKEAIALIKTENVTLQSLQMKYQEKNLLAQGAQREVELLQQQNQKQIEQRELQVNQYDNQINQKLNQVQSMDLEITDLQSKLDNVVSLDNTTLTKLNTEIASFNQAVASIKNKLSEVSSHNMKINSLKSELTRLESSISRATKERDDLQRYLDNPEQPCPTCGTITMTEEGLLDQAGIELEDTKMALDDLNKSKQDLNTQIETFQTLNAEDLNKDLVSINQEISSRQRQVDVHNSSIGDYNRLSSKIESSKTFISSMVTELNNLKLQKSDLINTPMTDYQDQINTKIQIANTLLEESTSIQNLIMNKNKYITQLESLKAGFKEVKSYTFNSVLKELTIKSNRYLQELFEVPISLQFTNDNMKINTDITMNGQTRPLGLLSGGQFRRTCLAVDLALSEIVALRTGSKINLRIFDEYMKDLSENSMEKCLRLLERLGGSTILIEHNSIFKSIVDSVFEVELSDGVSRSVA